ncbi:rRNA pseudouridine synthase [Leptospira wolffii]|uniref:pseudouridine synthase n=1 Tax=Leptospira wolffii TaxID=409998 RepID=UPI0003493E22|nr:pseudouridine synthase [Leptospira wolffii]TGK60278.1 rRNA pseudouridine synthase [Leptospira wolffii]TGK70054.1 rRNA pseudouridine synthase [Leptospira wolffii]TGK76284.1 rRNA pseudouridine synthase [Leptospira wolffii]TGL30536.1 rRNA pseudouridine synthase [Leptospira wolffii]
MSPKTEKNQSSDKEESPGIRINRYLADCGFGSRRKVEELVLSGKVRINGIPETDLSTRVRPGDQVTVSGKQASPNKRSIFLALNKPKGFLCSHGDRFHSHTVFELLPSKYSRLSIAGRLDLDSRGLLLLSDDGNWIQEITHPSEGQEKEYEVLLDKEIPFEETKTAFLKGIRDEGEILKAEKLFSSGRTEYSDRFRVVLKQGRKRQIKRMFSALGARVEDLRRIRIGRILLEKLKIEEGKFVLLDPKDWRP